MKQNEVEVCIVGGGPAGMVTALLLAHHGVKVLVVEQHKDFAREYRGEVLMPRFSQMMKQIHLDDWLLGIRHLKLKFGEIMFRGRRVGQFDFSRSCPEFPYALWMPQPLLLQSLYEKAKTQPSFEMWFGASVKHLLKNGDSVEGVVVQRGKESVEVRSRVVVGSDGRYSAVAKDGGFELEYEDHRFDILWFSIPKPAGYDNGFRVLLSPKRSYLLLPKHPDEIQVGILTGKGGMQEMRELGIERLRTELREATPLFREFAAGMKDFSAFHPLQAHLHLVKRWARPGCLLIGDSAHCCSPAGAIGVSMATGSAILAGDVILRGLRAAPSGVLPTEVLDEVQRVYEPEIRKIHSLQRRLVGGALTTFVPIRWLLPLAVSVLARTPFFRRAQRELMTLTSPLPISPSLGFE